MRGETHQVLAADKVMNFSRRWLKWILGRIYNRDDTAQLFCRLQLTIDFFAKNNHF